MAYLRQATDNPFGFMPYDQVLSIGAYHKDSSAAAVYPGDVVVMETDGRVATTTDTSPTGIVGVAAMYSAASTDEPELLVYDHPEQLFVVQDDGDTTAMTESSIGNNVDLVVTTGDTTLLRSKHELDSSSAATTAGLAAKVVRLHPIEERSFASAAGDPRKWVVKFNLQSHFRQSDTGI